VVSRFIRCVAVALATMAVSACSANSSAPYVTVTVTAPPSATQSAPSLTEPSSSAIATQPPAPSPTSARSQATRDPLASVKIDKNSAYTAGQQRYLYALRQALNNELVDNFEIALVAAGQGACGALDSDPEDEGQLRSTLNVIDSYLTGSSISAEYVVLAAAAGLCPSHKKFVTQQLGGNVG
jgi:hypothetical protein